MKIINQVPSVPLLVLDPHFSIWSPANNLTDASPESWTGKKIPLEAYLISDEKSFNVIGTSRRINELKQTSLDISPTTTTYEFENEDLFFELKFSSQFDLNNVDSLTEPISTIQFKYRKKNKLTNLKFEISFPKELCAKDPSDKFLSRKVINSGIKTIWMGKAKQTPLNNSGDIVDIDWGYLYLAAESKKDIQLNYDNAVGLVATFDLSQKEGKKELLVAYDDISSIQYFGQVKSGLWFENEETLFSRLVNACKESRERENSRERVDFEIRNKSQKIGGNSYELITSLSYRQAIGAHKLIKNENEELIYLSKECSSNGCIGTVDISYPSIPLFLAYQPELVNAMLRPIFKFSKQPVWEFDYAPHDVGRYPYATGQVYGLMDDKYLGVEDTPIMYSQYPKGQIIYNENMQMPIEESGNMLIMVSLAFLSGASDKTIKENRKLLDKWADYLVKNSTNPKSQLCTDDFAGHLANNVNLSLKGIVALSVYGKVLSIIYSEENTQSYSQQASILAEEWKEKARINNHTKLSFDKENSWSLKYNIIWNYLLDLNLFDNDLINDELSFYKKMENRYGIPLDSRESYTKVDWQIWVATLSKNKFEFEGFLIPIIRYLEESPNRVPFSDWYDTKTAEVMNFKNRTVLGAVFLPFLFLDKEKKYAKYN